MEVQTISQQQVESWMSFFKEAVFQLRVAVQILIRVCLFAAGAACQRHGSDLSSDCLGKMALGLGWAFGRVQGLWLQGI